MFFIAIVNLIKRFEFFYIEKRRNGAAIDGKIVVIKESQVENPVSQTCKDVFTK